MAASSKTPLRIIEEQNVIDDHLLDIIGNEFNFDHEKGLAEWLKNSVDAYLRNNVADSDQYVIYRFLDGGKGSDPIFECIDFVGMSETDIEKAFKRWGDPEAAKRGLNRRVYGGHGNGGKFYMRQMFQRSHFITLKDGKLSIFGFSENKKYGFAAGYKNKKISAGEAMKIAGINNLEIPKIIKKKITDGKTGFTLVRGIRPYGIKTTIRPGGIVEKFKTHPQSRRILDRINVWAIHNDVSPYTVLKSAQIKPLVGFEEPRVLEIPKVLPSLEDGVKSAELRNRKYSSGRLILRTSEEAFAKGSKTFDLNRIDIIGEIGVIASYPVYELGVSTFPQASFIYGDCECPILEDPEMDSVKNDRTRLVGNPRSRALLAWIRSQIDELAGEITAKERAEQEAERKRISTAYNDYLNRWKDQFMRKFMGDLFKAGFGEDGDGSGGTQRGTLVAPENGIEFVYSLAQIPMNEPSKITLKTASPKPVPVGSIIELSCSNAQIALDASEITVRVDDLKTTADGDTVAVINTSIIGKRSGETGILRARVGKFEDEIEIQVIEAGGNKKDRKPKSPQVLLSGMEPDPLGIAPGGTVTLTERDPLVYQRIQDVAEGIFWINTDSPLAKAILDKYGDHSERWRDYLFQRYVDIFIKSALYELQKREPEGFTAARVDSDILDMMVKRVHAAALNDLGSFFFEEGFNPQATETK